MYDFTLTNDVFLSHETSLEIALEIAKSGVILANDPHCHCANFSIGPNTKSHTENSGVSLLFGWSGEVVRHRETDKRLVSGKLYHFSTNTNDGYDENSYWVSRIYPNTQTGLRLVGVLFTATFPQSIPIRQRWALYKLSRIASKRSTIRVLSQA